MATDIIRRKVAVAESSEILEGLHSASKTDREREQAYVESGRPE